MDEVGVARAARSRLPERSHHRRQERGAERGPPQVPDHAVPVGDPVVVEPKRRDHVHVQAASAQPLDGLPDEVARRIPGEAGIRGREHGDLHGRSTGSSSS